MKKTVLSILTVLATNLIHPIVSGENLDISGQPTIGDPKSTVKVVAFLEPKCPDSKKYSNTSFPKLQTQYINTNKISYTVITTSFLSQSMPAAIALLCVYNQDPKAPHTDLFFKFLSYIYQNQPPESENWATLDRLLKFAGAASTDIDQKQLKDCIENAIYRDQIEKNTAYGNFLMGHLTTPTIYVNGVKIENTNQTIDYEKLKAAIDQALPKKAS